MGVLDAESLEYLKGKFEELEREVDLNLYYAKTLATGESLELIEYTEQMLKEIADISDKIKLNLKEYKEGENEKGIYIRTNPTVTIGEDLGYTIVFNGSPVGYEASQLIETLVLASKGEPMLDTSIPEEKIKALAELPRSVRIMTFVTPSCPYCPMAVLYANKLSIASNGKVISETIEANENMELSMKWKVEAVPLIVIDDREDKVFVGVQPEPLLVDQVLSVV